jgi:hypothetical protein
MEKFNEKENKSESDEHTQIDDENNEKINGIIDQEKSTKRNDKIERKIIKKRKKVKWKKN